MLYAKESPIFGGDTVFTNMYAAYEALSDTMKSVARAAEGPVPRRSRRRGRRTVAQGELSRPAAVMKPKDSGADEGTQAEHPIVRTHPETGRKSLFLSSHTAKIVGMTDDGKRADPGLPAAARGAPRVHLPLPLGARFVRDLGRPLHAAFRHQRLQRPAPGDAPDHGAG